MMNGKIIGVIILLIIIITVYFKISYGFTPEHFLSNGFEIDYFDYYPQSVPFQKPKKIKTVCFISGVHGNEQAGPITMLELINNGTFQNLANEVGVHIRVIPTVNKFGLIHNTRYQANFLFPDINRNFIGKGLDSTSGKIVQLIENFDVVLDFHEGWGWYQNHNGSVGSTLSPGNTQESIKMAELAVDKINQEITDPKKKFTVLYNRSCEIPRTLSCHRECDQKHYVLIETSGQNNIQPMYIRKRQVVNVINEVLKFVKENNNL